MNELNYEYVTKRVLSRVPTFDIFRTFGLTQFYVAGSCLNRDKPNDIDIFPHPYNSDFENETGSNPFLYSMQCVDFTESGNKSTLKSYGFEFRHQSDNALTFLHIKSNTLIQFCFYKHRDLKSLVDSFDYSHVQIGAEVRISNNITMGSYDHVKVSDIYLSTAYKQWCLDGTTQYTGSDYPFSSLLRSTKYYERGIIKSKTELRYIVIKCLASMCKRGFENYEDFKDQLAAIDLNLKMNKYVKQDLIDLYKCLTKDDSDVIPDVE